MREKEGGVRVLRKRKEASKEWCNSGPLSSTKDRHVEIGGISNVCERWVVAAPGLGTPRI